MQAKATGKAREMSLVKVSPAKTRIRGALANGRNRRNSEIALDQSPTSYLMMNEISGIVKRWRGEIKKSCPGVPCRLFPEKTEEWGRRRRKEKIYIWREGGPHDKVGRDKEERELTETIKEGYYAFQDLKISASIEASIRSPSEESLMVVYLALRVYILASYSYKLPGKSNCGTHTNSKTGRLVPSDEWWRPYKITTTCTLRRRPVEL